MLYSRTLFIHSKCCRLHLPTPDSQPIPLPSPPPSWQPQVWSLCLWVFLCFVDRFSCAIFWIPHTTDVVRYLSFWLTSRSFNNLASMWLRMSFLWLNSIPLCIHYIFFIPSSVDQHLGGFHVLAIVNSAAMNVGLHISFWITVLSRYMPRSRIARSFYFSFSEKPPYCFP